MYFVIFICLFILNANGIIIPPVAWGFAGFGLFVTFVNGFCEKYKENKEKRGIDK